MDALKSYPAYRDSGLPWLGQLPTGWDVVRGKYLFREVDDRTDTGTETLLSMRQAHGLIPHTKVSTKPVTPEQLKGYKRVRAGQMVLNRMQASNGMFAVAREDGLVSPDYAVFQPLQPMEPDFFVELFKTSIFRAKFRQESKGLGTGTSGFLRLYSDRFGAVHVPQPLQAEQRRIVEFVRGYDFGVRRLIRNKRRLIGLLNEQKQAIINRAVTRGLNPNAPMKPTGIDWMPEVPAHWGVKPLKQICEVLFSNVDKHSHDGERQVRLCNYTDVYKNDFIMSDMDFMAATATPAEIERFHLEVGDVMITKDSEAWNDIGVPAIVTEALEGVLCGYHLALLRAERDALLPMFLFRALTTPSIAQQLYFEATGVTRYGLSKLAIKNLLLPVPPLHEQSALVAAMVAAIEPLSASAGRVNQEISLVREYRDRLITDVITGKLDVRHIEIAAPADEPISDEDDALEELDEDDAEVMEGADAEE